MTEEKSNNKTLILIVTVCSFLAIGLVSILKERETVHLNYSENTSVEQEAELYKHVKDYNNVVMPETDTAVKSSAKKSTPKKHAMQNSQPFTTEAPKHTMQNTNPSANQDTSEAPKHTMRNN